MRRAGLILTVVALLASGCNPFRRADPEPPTVSVFALPVRAAPLESDITRLDGRAQAAIVNNLAEIGGGDPVGFLETIASPVFRGDTAQDEQDLSRMRLRLVFSVQSPTPRNPGPRWIKITLDPKPGKFITWTRLVTESEDVDLEQLRFQPLPPQSSLHRSRRPGSTSVSLEEGKLTILRRGDTLGGFILDTEIDLGRRQQEIYVGRLHLKHHIENGSQTSAEESEDSKAPKGPAKRLDPKPGFVPTLRLQRIHLPKTWTLQASLQVESEGREPSEAQPRILFSEERIDLTLWEAKAQDGDSPALALCDKHQTLYFASYQEAMEVLELLEREKLGKPICKATAKYIPEPILVTKLLGQGKETAP